MSLWKKVKEAWEKSQRRWQAEAEEPATRLVRVTLSRVIRQKDREIRRLRDDVREMGEKLRVLEREREDERLKAARRSDNEEK